MCVFVKESLVIITVFKRSILKAGKLLSSKVMWNSICYLTEQKWTEEILFELENFILFLKTNILCGIAPSLELLWWSAPGMLKQLCACLLQKNHWIILEDTRTQNWVEKTLKPGMHPFEQKTRAWASFFFLFVISLITINPTKKVSHYHSKEEHWLWGGQWHRENMSNLFWSSHW